MTMRLRNAIAIGMLGFGLTLSPALVSSTRAADEPAKDAPKEAPKEAPKPAENPGGRQGGQRNPGQFLERYHQAVLGVNLTDEQKPKIETAFADAKKKMDEASKEGQPSREKVQPIREELTKAVNAVLTDEQKKKLQESMPQRGQGGQGGGRRPAGGGTGGQPPAGQKPADPK
jgi:Spy/CpxP family protein refolding chaperone